MAHQQEQTPIVIPVEDDVLLTRNVPMTTTSPLQPPQQHDTPVLPPTLASLSTLSTLWVPLDETIGRWAMFAHEAITVSALLATGTAFYGLAWEAKALRHYTWACYERTRGRVRKEAHWLERAVQDLDCAIDQWQQVLSWLHLAGNDDQRQDPASLDTIRSLMGQVNEHQARRRALHQQVQQEYASAKQQVRRQHKEEPQR
jgi:hypothetical protein